MSANLPFGRTVRLRRLYRHGGTRLLVVPMDHTISDGPIVVAGGPGALVAQLAAAGVDAIVLHKGGLRFVEPGLLSRTALIVHLSASTRHAPDPDAKYLVASVEEALRLGADAVSVHVNLGSADEARQVADLARVAESCDRWGMPLLAMMYPRGPRIENPRDPQLVAHAGVLAADLGADLVKLPYVGAVDAMADVVRSCPVPVIVAGGPRLPDTGALLSHVDEVLSAGVEGLAMGRNIFEAPDAGRLARLVAGRVHAEPVTALPPRELTTAAR
ncbi:2-amino-3,7-dideoxy-D-threo-hept-6-ulosonate synthase [Actinoplanes sp. NPDC048791]|uniref:2-amino-3,7-dideoxy-D-threo-hept-6-ulosonate synthase n=1 Tax=Actinoplanes sp. NPDC048791 TaxID=3154623 RepID=UPI0034091B45